MFFCLCYMLKVEHCESPQSHRLDFCGWLSQLQCEPHKPVAKWCMPHTESQTKYRYKVVEITKFLKVIGIKKKEYMTGDYHGRGKNNFYAHSIYLVR